MSDEKKNIAALPMQYRAGIVDAERKEGERLSGADPGRFRFTVSSEEPVRRWFGNEILDHSKDSVRTGRLDAGAVPGLLNHEQRFGKVDKYSLKDGKLTVEGPFSRTQFAQDVRQDYDDGILTNASVGYRVHKMVRTEDEDNPNMPDECRVTDWEPFDASLVDVPADATVGVGRAANAGEEFPVAIQTISRRSAQSAAQPIIEIQPQEKRNMAETATAPSASELEIARRNEIMAVATDKDFRKYTSIDEAQKAIAEGTSVDKFKDQVTRKIVEENDAAKVGTAGDNIFRNLPENAQKRYSVLRLVRGMVNQMSGTKRFAKEISDNGLEMEVSQELARNLKVQTEGPLMPLSAARALGTQGIGSGAGQIAVTSEAAAVETITRPEVIELLRHRARVLQLGARTLGGLQGVIRLPRQTGANTATWTTEGAAGTPADLTMDYVSMQPRRITQQTSWTIELLAETSPDVEGLARMDLDKVRNLALDLAAISGSGTSGQPTGIMNTTGLTLLAPSGTAFSDGGKPLLWSDVLAYESTVAAADADVATSGWLFTPEVRAQLKATAKFTAGSVAGLVAIWEDGPKDPIGLEVGPLGYMAGVTNQLAKNGTKAGVTGSILHNSIFGDFSQLIFADWGVQEVVVDPYTQALNGAVIVTARSLHDIAIRHIAAFVANPYIAIS